MPSTSRNSLDGSAVLTKWLTYILYATVLVDLVAVGADLLQIQLLSDFQSGAYASRALAIAAANANDDRQQLIGILQIGIYCVAIIVFAVWIHRANRNARRLGAQGMKFTPRWAVGYYFIPILNLWKPYQAMKEIWRASKAPASWQRIKRGAILPWWWAFWLMTNVTGYVLFRATRHAEGIDALIGVSKLWLVADAIDAIAVILAIVLVQQISRMQARECQYF